MKQGKQESVRSPTYLCGTVLVLTLAFVGCGTSSQITGDSVEARLDSFQIVEPGQSLVLEHNLNTVNPSVAAHFYRAGKIRSVDSYESEVGRKKVILSGNDLNSFVPFGAQFQDGTIGLIWPYYADLNGQAFFGSMSDEGDWLMRPHWDDRLTGIGKNLPISRMTEYGLVVFARDIDGDPAFRVLDSAGVALVEVTKISDDINILSGTRLDVLSNGNVVVSYSVNDGFGNYSLFFAIIDPSNGDIVVEPELHQDGPVTAYGHDVVATEDGFIFVHRDMDEDQLLAQRYANDGSPVDNDPVLIAEGVSRFIGATFAHNKLYVYFSNTPEFYSVFAYISADLTGDLEEYSMGQGRNLSRGINPAVLGNGNVAVCIPTYEIECFVFDENQDLVYRTGFIEGDAETNSSVFILPLGSEGRFAFIFEADFGQDEVFIYFLSDSPGRLDLEVVDENTVRVVNNSSESLPIRITLLYADDSDETEE